MRICILAALLMLSAFSGAQEFDSSEQACQSAYQQSLGVSSQLGNLSNTVNSLAERINGLQADLQKTKAVTEQLDPTVIKGYYDKVSNNTLGYVRQIINPIVLFAIPLIYFTVLVFLGIMYLRGYYSSKIQESENRYALILRGMALLNEKLGVQEAPQKEMALRPVVAEKPVPEKEDLREREIRKLKEERKKLIEGQKALLKRLEEGN